MSSYFFNYSIDFFHIVKYWLICFTAFRRFKIETPHVDEQKPRMWMSRNPACDPVHGVLEIENIQITADKNIKTGSYYIFGFKW